MDNALNTPNSLPEAQLPDAKETKQPEKKKADEEFSIAWNIKVLAVIYIVLGILYVVLKFTLK